MAMDRSGGIIPTLERKLGLIPLAELSETLNSLPDAKQLKLINSVLTHVENISQDAPDLERVIYLIHEISMIPSDKLDKLDKVLKRVEKIMKSAPEEIITLLSSLK